MKLMSSRHQTAVIIVGSILLKMKHSNFIKAFAIALIIKMVPDRFLTLASYPPEVILLNGLCMIKVRFAHIFYLLPNQETIMAL